MNILSVTFLLFLVGLLPVYYLVPKRFQWWVLLAASLVFYAFGGPWALVFPVITSLSAWGTARLLQRSSDGQKDWLKAHKAELDKQARDDYKARCKRRRRRLLTLCLLLNFGILCAFKYVHFLLEQADAVARLFGGGVTDTIQWIVPLGISFYTFQTVGYVLDVYWGRTRAERNPFRMLLFTSFFPQITQGPISNFGELSEQLFSEHRFRYANYAQGAQRMLWGLFKKIVIANSLVAPLLAGAFRDYGTYSGLSTLLCAFLYSLEIYADFSGYMDIMCGLCRMLDIQLTENFLRPYFSKSVAEYWRRWHISLGVWFKNYLYYPLAVSRWNQRLGKWSKKRLGKAFGDYLPATLALIVVWLATGLWHGASWAYIAWGGVNGLFIIVSMWMERVFTRWKKGLRINESAWLWRAFQVLRTFFLITLIKVLPEVGTLSDGLGFWRQIFVGGLPHSFAELIPGATPLTLALIVLCAGLLLTVSLLQRKAPLFRQWARVPKPLRYALLAGLLAITLYFSGMNSLGGFLYAGY